MGIIDKARRKLRGHEGAAKNGIDKVADKADNMTGNKYGSQIDKAAGKAKGGVDSMNNDAGSPSQGDAAQRAAADQAHERLQ